MQNDRVRVRLLFCTKQIALHEKQQFKIRAVHYHCTRHAVYVGGQQLTVNC
jgi:hypothetical protein